MWVSLLGSAHEWKHMIPTLFLHGSLCQTHPFAQVSNSEHMSSSYISKPQGFRINKEGSLPRAHGKSPRSPADGGGFARCNLLLCVFLLQECMNPCCNATTCTLTGDAVCAHGQCCDDCKVRGCRSDQCRLLLPGLNDLCSVCDASWWTYISSAAPSRSNYEQFPKRHATVIGNSSFSMSWACLTCLW